MKKQSALTLLIATTLLAPSRAESPRPGQDTGTLTGDVVVAVKHVDGGRATDYAIFVDASTGAKPSDGQVDHIFRLQAAAQPGAERHLVIRSARVAWSPGKVSVQDESVGDLTFTIRGEQDAPAPDLHTLAARPSDWTVDGYGLAHTVGWDITLPDQGCPTTPMSTSLEWQGAMPVMPAGRAAIHVASPVARLVAASTATTGTPRAADAGSRPILQMLVGDG